MAEEGSMTDEEATTTVDSPATESDLAVADTAVEPATGDATIPTGVEAEAEESGEPGPIPYNRFKEVNDQFKELKAQKEAEAAILQQFGFGSLEEMRQAAELEQQRLEEERVSAYYQTQVDEGELDETTAGMRRDLEIQRMQFQRERMAVQELLLQQQRQAALSVNPAAAQAPDMVDELIRSGVAPDRAAAQVAAMVERFSLAAKSQAIRQPSVPAPMGSTNQSAQPTRPQSPLDAWRAGASRSWRDIFNGKDTL